MLTNLTSPPAFQSPFPRDALRDYFERALKRGGQTPHLLEEAFSWHNAFRREGSMKAAFAAHALCRFVHQRNT